MDIVLAIVPRIIDDFGYTPAGPALLKGSLAARGFSSKIIDFNAELDEIYKDDQALLSSIGNYFMNHTLYNQDVFELVDKWITKWAYDIIDLAPTWVGISVFSYNSQRATRLLAIRLKTIDPDIKIVVGGAGIATDFTFCETLYQEHIIDAYIRGEGEISLIELLNGNLSYPGINGIPFQQINDINNLAYPVYDDYELSDYTNRKGLIALPITGSRGCVRSCTFCDIASMWPKYRFRDGKNIAEEIKYQVERHGVNAFRFTDSLINGSLKAFKDMIKELAEYRMGLPEHRRFIWDSHFIVRGPRDLKPEIFDLMRDSGAGTMLMGVESGSQPVRDHMKKGFTQDELDYCMEQFARTGIKTRFLIIVGYPTETEEDFQNSLDMFSKYKPYCDQGVIEEVNLGLTLNLLHNTPLTDNLEKYQITQENNHINNWVCLSNPSLDYKERLRRRIYLQQHIENLGYKVFESKNYTNQLFIAWNEVMTLRSQARIIEDFKYDRDQGGLVEKSLPTVTHIKIHEHKNQTIRA
jgi:radical SAM superfamily enzyme YgiQ (UPF0313 family)